MSDPTREPERIPDSCWPSPAVLDALERGPQIDPCSRRIVSDGPWNGMTADEVLADREAFRRACGE